MLKKAAALAFSEPTFETPKKTKNGPLGPIHCMVRVRVDSTKKKKALQEGKAGR
jgi:hypothetical protein